MTPPVRNLNKIQTVQIEIETNLLEIETDLSKNESEMETTTPLRKRNLRQTTISDRSVSISSRSEDTYSALKPVAFATSNPSESLSLGTYLRNNYQTLDI